MKQKNIIVFLCMLFSILYLTTNYIAAERGSGRKRFKDFAFPTKQLSKKDKVLFFPSNAEEIVEGGKRYYKFTIHGRVYRDGVFTNAARRLQKLIGARVPVNKIKGDVARDFLTVGRPNKQVVVNIGGKAYPLRRSRIDGHFFQEMKIPVKEMKAIQEDAFDKSKLIFSTPQVGRKTFEGKLFLTPKEGISIISDIDDTLKDTHSGGKFAMIKKTFFRKFEEIPGMKEAYRTWAKKHNASFHFVSGSVWQMYPSLSKFFREEGFPEGTFHLKYLGSHYPSFLEAMRTKKYDYKVKHITSIMDKYPDRKFVLIGDSGDKDPEVYGAIARKYRNQVKGIMIRDIGAPNSTEARFAKAFADIDAPWGVYEHGDELIDLDLDDLMRDSKFLRLRDRMEQRLRAKELDLDAPDRARVRDLDVPDDARIRDLDAPDRARIRELDVPDDVRIRRRHLPDVDEPDIKDWKRLKKLMRRMGKMAK